MSGSNRALESLFVSVLRARDSLAAGAVRHAALFLDEALAIGDDALSETAQAAGPFPGQEGPLQDYIQDLHAIIVAQNKQIQALAAENAALSEGHGLSARLSNFPLPPTPHG